MGVIKDPNKLSTSSPNQVYSPSSSASNLVQRVLDAKTQAMELAAVGKEMGITAEEAAAINTVAKENKSAGQEALATTIVSKSMDLMNNMNTKLQSDAQAASTQLNNAIEEKNQAKQDVLVLQIQNLQKIADKYENAMKELQENQKPEKLIELFTGLRKLNEELTGVKQGGSTPAQAIASDGSLQLQMQKMQQDHELAMKNMDIQLAQFNQKFGLELAQFNEENKRKWQEYQDNKKMKEQGLGGLEDILGAIGAGLARDRQAEEISEAANISADVGNGGQEKQLIADLTKFRCPTCGSDIIVPEGAESASCPNEQCGAVYKIRPNS